MGYRNYSTAVSHIVDTNGQGDFTTIGAALTAASSGQTIFIRPGTYSESPTLKAGVNLVAFGSDGSLNATGNVIINGNCTLSTAGSVTISGIQLQTNSGNLLTVSGSVASIVNLNNCYLNCSNNTGISFSSSSASAKINIYECTGDVGTTGIALFAHSSAGTLSVSYSSITNSGSSTTANTVSGSGQFNHSWSNLNTAVTTSSTANLTMGFAQIDTSAINTTALTIGGTGGNNICVNSYIASGSASALSISQSFHVWQTTFSSTNTNCITGAGAISYANLSFSNTSKTINTTTQSIAGVAFGSTTTAPTAGMIGEQIRSAIGSGAAINLSNNTAANITSINVTAGVWDISGIGIITDSGTNTQQIISVTTSSATNGTLGDNSGTFVVANNFCTITIPAWRQTFTTTTTVYLVAFCSFSTGASTAYGRISATRVA